ncbi:hypothetical protein CTEN210_17866 [Chaetoceros tenuissimus]|uniref:RRM domain-containing protein n=1 Tax=Chaetoceros tenuissimus TaxID=426638 RepID=A0AAD3DE97_9STRA|nr:hypothetical protein CTEN210_17866 [Chaetoceros tenuissimus]
MIFQKQSIAIILACVASTASAFSLIPSSTRTAIVTKPLSIANYGTQTSSPLFMSDNDVVATTEETPAEEGDSSESEKPQEDISKVAYVVNLNYDTPFADIKETFAKYGTVEKVFVAKNKETGKNKGIAFVTMSTEEERDAAIEALNDKELDGRVVYVNKAKPRGSRNGSNSNLTKLYIGNIAFDTSAEDLTSVFSEYGELTNVYLPVDRFSGQPRGFAFLEMEKDAAEKAIEACNGMSFGGRTIDVKVSLPRGVKAPPRKNETKLYVGNVSFDTEINTLRELFQEYGPVIDLYMPLDQSTGSSRGFAFVTLEPENALRAIEEVDGWEVDGRELRVNEAQPKGSGNNNNNGNYNDEAAQQDEVNEW